MALQEIPYFSVPLTAKSDEVQSTSDRTAFE